MAAREVFNLGELLLMIITHLDDLSLVRIQRVNKLCQWAVSFVYDDSVNNTVTDSFHHRFETL